MKVIKFEDQPSWLLARRGKITGSRLKDIVVKRGTGRKIGFYALIAERLGLPADDTDPKEWGHLHEGAAVERFEAKTGKKVNRDLVLWTRDDNQNIAVSPDGVIGKKGSEAVEVKCLSTARHLEAVITNQVPDEHWYQVIQYFAVNDDLDTLHFCFYDPRLRVKDFHVITIERSQVIEEVKEMLEYERKTIEEVEAIVAELSQF